MNIILFGPPGAGKGTQADKIAKNFKLHKISTGELLRKEIKNNTTIGSKIKSKIDKGFFVPDDVINDLILKILLDKNLRNRLIFDGYPRNLIQAKNLDLCLKDIKQKISLVINLNVEKKFIIKRILGRQTCGNCGLIFNEYFNPSTAQNHSCNPKFLVKRSDDNEETIAKRLETYLNKTLPILEFYKKQNLLHEVDGMHEIDQIFEKIRGIIASLETWLCIMSLYKYRN